MSVIGKIRAMKKNVIDLTMIETPTMTKADIAEKLFERIGLSKREAKDIVEAFFDQITQSLVNGEEVKLSGFGNYQVRSKASRPGRNPRTGEEVPIKARRVVTFHASNKLKCSVQEQKIVGDVPQTS